MNVSRLSRGSRGQSSAPSRGGIRKRGAPPRVDRDGDLDMDGRPAKRGTKPGAREARGRGDRARPESGRGIATGSQGPGRDSRRQGGDRDKALDAIQKAIFSNSDQANIRQGRRSDLEQLIVRGWKQSKAATNPDGGIDSLITFLEKKASSGPNSATIQAKITKSRVEGDGLVISIRPELKDRIIHLNGFSFAGAQLIVEEYKGSKGGGKRFGRVSETSTVSTADTKARMTAFLARRYKEPEKILDLSGMQTDPDLLEMGMFGNASTESKFFPALMKIWEMGFDSHEKRREAVHSVTLANNQLANVSFVTTLSQSFPDLRNLDLSNNQFKEYPGILAWRWKFRNLDFLDLSGNPISSLPDFKDTMMKWYPKLRTLNNTQVRTDEDIAAQRKTPIPVLPAYFSDDSKIAENFITAFFSGFDNSRTDLVNGVYDAKTTFSLNVNTSAPRLQQDSAGWDQWIRKSRNLLKISHLPARMSRSYVGTEKIRELWESLPKTRHPDILQNPAEWLIECHPLPALPDITGQSPTGVGGLVIMAHSKFDELDPTTGEKTHTRSFDRTLVLGPGNGIGGLRIVTDMLCLRAYGGSQAWVPEGEQPIPPPTALPAAPAVVPPALVPPPAAAAGSEAQPQPIHPEAKDGYGMPAPGKPEEQLKQEQMVLEMSFRSKMTLEYSQMALSGNGWNLDLAWKNFEDLKAQGSLPPTAFLQGV